jgi:hypothetical protein
MVRNHFGRTPWYSLVMRLKWKLVLVRSEIVTILMQDMCIDCAEHTTGSKISMETPNGTPR